MRRSRPRGARTLSAPCAWRRTTRPIHDANTPAVRGGVLDFPVPHRPRRRDRDKSQETSIATEDTFAPLTLDASDGLSEWPAQELLSLDPPTDFAGTCFGLARIGRALVRE